MHSQKGEEAVILKCVEKYEGPGRFLDIGAADGVTFSNTRALAEMGWTGSPHHFQRLREVYPEGSGVDLAFACIGLERRLVRFWDTPDFVSTTEEENLEKWGRDKFTPIYVATTTPHELRLAFPGEFQVVSIDTEGTSTDLFFAFFDMDWHVWVYVVEHDGRNVEIAERAREKGYETRYLDGNNIILARRF